MQTVQRASVDEDISPTTTFERLFARIDHVHGVTEWYSSKTHISKALWTVILLVALVLLTVEVSMCVYGFVNSPIVTSYKLVNEPDGIALPEIFICPSNPVDIRNKEQFDSDWVEQHVEGLFKNHAKLSGLSGLLAANAKLSATTADIRNLGGSTEEKDCTMDPVNPCKEPLEFSIPNNVQDYFMNVGYDGDNFLKECSFGAKPIECGSIATAYFDGDYGKCFHIHVDEKQAVDGVGLSLVVDLAMKESYRPFNKPLFDGVIVKLNKFNHPLTNDILQLSADVVFAPPEFALGTRVKRHYGPPDGGYYGGEGNEENGANVYASICHHPIVTMYRKAPFLGDLPTVEASHHKRWAYDMEQKDCIEFDYFGWIGGENGFPTGIKTDTGENSFPNKNACLNNCAYGNRCVAADLLAASCQGKSVRKSRYYYNLEHHECLRFRFKGCDGNANHFRTREDCQLACGNDLQTNRCLVYMSDVDVVYRETRWVFNREDWKCEQIYVELFDCQIETPNRFANRNECELACNTDRDVDKEPLDTMKESCMGNIRPRTMTDCNQTTRYYYDASNDVCNEVRVSELFQRDYLFDTVGECAKNCSNITYVKPTDWNGLNPDALPPFKNLSAFTKDTEKMQNGDFIIINIAHRSLLHVQMVQTYSMTFSTFVSNIGGQMGLWLGCSIISVLKVGSIIGPVIYLLTKQLLTKLAVIN